jgi:hypothetical protein
MPLFYKYSGALHLYNHSTYCGYKDFAALPLTLKYCALFLCLQIIRGSAAEKETISALPISNEDFAMLPLTSELDFQVQSTVIYVETITSQEEIEVQRTIVFVARNKKEIF